MEAREHPAKFNRLIIDTAGNILEDEGIDGGERLLDPFAGTGRIFWLLERFPHLDITGIEIEEGWVAHDDRLTLGDALDNGFPDGYFDIVFTSPTYGNRMADSFVATNSRRRNTYRHKYGKPLQENNSGTLQWGKKYRDFHRDAWMETIRTLAPGGLFLLNIKDHIRAGERQYVTLWHKETLENMGLQLTGEARIPCRGNREGQNGNARVDYESILVFRKGE